MVWLEVHRSIVDISADTWASQGPGWWRQLVRMWTWCSLCCALWIDDAEAKKWFRHRERMVFRAAGGAPCSSLSVQLNGRLTNHCMSAEQRFTCSKSPGGTELFVSSSLSLVGWCKSKHLLCSKMLHVETIRYPRETFYVFHQLWMRSWW